MKFDFIKEAVYYLMISIFAIFGVFIIPVMFLLDLWKNVKNKFFP